VFPVLFLASIVVSNPPADNAAASVWTADYSGQTNQVRHLATGLLLVVTGLCFATFITALWQRVRAVDPELTPLPLVAAAVSAAGIAAGGVVMAFVSGGELMGSFPLPGVDVLRLSNDLGFALVGVVGMLAAALAVASISVQGHAAGVLSGRTRLFGLVVAIALLGALAFVPILGLLVWTPTLAIQSMRGGTRASAATSIGG
jgi:hypothetical protein